MKTNMEELDLNEMETVNGGIAGTAPSSDEGIKAVCEFFGWIASWFD